MTNSKDRTVNKTVKVQPYISVQAMGHLRRLLKEGTYGNSINSVAQRMIEEGLNQLFEKKPLKRK